uniref:Uncharacterized protein n=1 Tax=Tanacetum cinerariifolium TaxID=118510 RepID=A0A6L2J2P0_TANCI|nr:hypothetical protein [Tanacetum cinerariifolium]
MYADVFVFAEIPLFAKGVHSGNYVTCVCWCLVHAMVSFKFSLMCGMDMVTVVSFWTRHVVCREKAYGLLQLLVF